MASRSNASFVWSCARACAWVAIGLTACADPVQSRLVDELGGEQPGIPEGPLHRAGQPCVACHGEYGPAEAEFKFGGTVYQDAVGTVAVPDARVTFIDSKGKTYETGTNCAGNFFVMKTDYDPVFPVWTSIFFGTAGGQQLPLDMGSPIYREGSCATCHADPASADATGHVYLSETPITIPPSPSCQ